MAKPDSWLEISLVCSSELAEAVAEVLARYAPDGVVLSSVTAFDQEAFEQRPTGEMRVSAYLPRDAAWKRPVMSWRSPYGTSVRLWRYLNQNIRSSPIRIGCRPGRNTTIRSAWVKT